MKNKYVYVVTRYIKNVSDNCIDVPNLGVHLKLKSAMEHFDSIKKDRKRYTNYKCYWDVKKTKANCPYEKYKLEYRRSLLEYEEFSGIKRTEDLLIERWDLTKK